MSKARQLADLGNVYDDGALSNRNLIINGAMQVAQRGTSTTSTNVYLIDRFKTPTVGITQYTSTTSQDTDAPSGFSNSLKVTTTTAETTIDAGDLVYISTELEGYDLQRLGYGTSDAKTATLSFWVKSSVTGTYCVGFYQYAGLYTYTTTYTINAANTWEYKTITLNGNTSDSIANNNTSGIRVSFILATGSTFNDGSASNAWESYAADKYAAGHVQDGVVTTLNATWQITGVQLEIGDSSTPFEHRSYADQLQACMRYYEQWDCVSGENILIGTSYNGQPVAPLKYVARKRASPTVTLPTAGQTSGTISFLNGTGGYPTTTGTHSTLQVNNRGLRITSSGYSGISSSEPAMIYSNGSTIFKFDAEL